MGADLKLALAGCRLSDIRFFALGFFALSSQVLLSREMLALFAGNEICIGTVLAFWLLGIAAGAVPGRILAGLEGKQDRVFSVLSFLLPLFLFVEVILARAARTFLEVPFSEYLSYQDLLLVSLFCVLPVSLLTGALFPVGCACRALGRDGDPGAVGRVYLFESAGAFAGGMGITFVVLPFFSQARSLFFVSALFFMMTAVGFVSGNTKIWRTAASFTAGLGCLALLFYDPGFEGFIERLKWQGAEGMTIVEWRDTPYQNLTVMEMEGQYSLFSNGSVVSSFPDKYAASAKAAFAVAQHENPDKVMMIGGAASGMIEELLRFGIGSLDLVELDGEVLELYLKFAGGDAREFFGDPRFSVHIGDGVSFLKNAGDRYDIIHIDAPVPSNAVANRYYTGDFFSAAASVLEDDGVMVISLPGSANYIGEELSRLIVPVYNGIAEWFPEVVIAPGTVNIFVAGKENSSIAVSVEQVSERLGKHGYPSEYFTDAGYLDFLQPFRMQAVNRMLAEQHEISSENELKPMGYNNWLYFWDSYSGSRLSGFLSKIAKRDSPLIMALMFALLSAAVVLFVFCATGNLSRAVSAAVFSAIAGTGFATIVLELVFVYVYQVSFSSIYTEIGALFAAFMAGLTAGAIIAGVFRRDGRAVILHFLVLELLFVLFAFAVLFTADVHSGIAIYALIASAGLIGGIQFRAADIILSSFSGNSNAGKRAAFLNFSDHAGALPGALICMSLLLPAAGFSGTAVLTGVLKGVSLTAVLIILFRLKHN